MRSSRPASSFRSSTGATRWIRIAQAHRYVEQDHKRGNVLVVVPKG
ncbi:MAG: hypothetical protein QM765_36065 [Myxococcales bacterium]